MDLQNGHYLDRVRTYWYVYRIVDAAIGGGPPVVSFRGDIRASGRDRRACCLDSTVSTSLPVALQERSFIATNMTLWTEHGLLGK